ncbi:MAG: hypothetical protein B1H04_00530 [Planctomycetales bacterium 4484_123]|nr:MAG: hypothetical protein B1H04_00530 [Planctomycetales bacterium 4484_123]
MASKEPIRDDDALRHVADKVPPAPGGTLAEFVEHLHSTGQPAILAADGREAWVPGVTGEMWRFPLHRTTLPADEIVPQLLRIKGIKIVSHFLEPDEHHPANCFHYVASDPEYSLASLSSNTRSKTRRGLRHFTIRLTSWEELVEKGFPAMVDTEDRHGYARPAPDTLERLAEKRRNSPFHELWGAWDGDQLAAWVEWVRVEDWALIGLACSRTDSLKKYPNNALIYAATRHFLVQQACSYVSYGISSVQAHSDTLVSLHRFKLQMRYEPIPMHRHFIPAPHLRPLLQWRACSWLWEQAARILPQVAALRKVAGMSRLLSGREKRPLAWAEGLD